MNIYIYIYRRNEEQKFAQIYWLLTDFRYRVVLLAVAPLPRSTPDLDEHFFYTISRLHLLASNKAMDVTWNLVCNRAFLHRSCMRDRFPQTPRGGQRPFGVTFPFFARGAAACT